ncbi:unnamed protein product [Amoebophrya sp. A25]|nr:unnamed protein product [Amoebophrya sp. A25]|eukprot:GSA25T00006274001.1
MSEAEKFAAYVAEAAEKEAPGDAAKPLGLAAGELVDKATEVDRLVSDVDANMNADKRAEPTLVLLRLQAKELADEVAKVGDQETMALSFRKVDRWRDLFPELRLSRNCLLAVAPSPEDGITLSTPKKVDGVEETEPRAEPEEETEPRALNTLNYDVEKFITDCMRLDIGMRRNVMPHI